VIDRQTGRHTTNTTTFGSLESLAYYNLRFSKCISGSCSELVACGSAPPSLS
jgi:hypothetical protein